MDTEYWYRKGDPTVLKLRGRFAVCHVEINGKALPFSLFEDRYEIGDLLVEGQNVLTLTLTVSNRNLLGPHHAKDPEPEFLFPNTFSFDKEWLGGGNCSSFVEEYSFVRFGIGF